jgi:hypothetical protein
MKGGVSDEAPLALAQDEQERPTARRRERVHGHYIGAHERRDAAKPAYVALAFA